MEFPGRLIAGFMIVILVFIFPLQYIAQLNSENIDLMVEDRTRKLTDSIRDKGYLDKQMYEEYVEYLDSTGERYDIEFQDIRPVKGEEYSAYNDNKRAASFERVSHNEIKSFSTHVHKEDCYAGYKHICNGTDCEYENTPIYVAAFQQELYTSKDGVSWTNTYSSGSPGYTFSSITYGNGIFVGLCGSTRILTSTDGVNWNVSNAIIDGSYATFDYITYGNGYFYTSGIFIASNHIYRVFKSSDGVNWSLAATLSDAQPKGIGVTASQYLWVIMDESQRSFQINSDGTLSNRSITQYKNFEYVNDVIPFGDSLFIKGRRNSLSVSALARNNRTSLSSIERNFNAVSYGGGKYIGVIVNDSYYRGIYTADNVYSLSWQKNINSILNNLKNIISMTYDGKTYLMYAINNNNEFVICKSTDLITWNTNSVPYQFRYMVCNAERGSGEIDRGPCIKEGKYYDNNGNEEQPICHQVVTSISATHPNQTIYENGDIITTAIATYLDGHTGIVNCTSNYNPNIAGKQTVTLTYHGLVGNAKTTGTRTCTVSVTVKAVRILTSIIVTPTSQTIQRYSSPAFTVTANYSDGTKKILNSSEYTITGFNAANFGTQNVTITYTEDETTKSATVKVTVVAMQKECPRCHNIYELNPDDTDPGCPFCKELITGIDVTPDYVEVTQGESLPITVMAIYNDGSREVVSGWISNYNPDRTGIQIVTVEYGGYSKDITVWVNDELIVCPICDTQYPKSESKCPVCAEEVERISVFPKEITVKQYETIPLTVTAYYVDGSSREVSDWTIDRDSKTPGKFTATVSYRGVTETISLTVLSMSAMECPICGTFYDIIENPKGCPICSEEIVGIEAYLTSGSNLVQLGTTPNIAVILIFRDEHREFATDGYTIEDFKPYELGIQTIRVLYKEFSTTVVIEVVNMLSTITCPNGHVYYKNDDGTDPGCPFCYVNEDVSNILYFDIIYTYDILNKVYSAGAYYFREGNYISVIVTKKDKSLLYRLQNTFFSTSMLGKKRRYIFGGEVY